MRRLCALLAAAALAACGGDGLPGPPDALDAMLSRVPASAVDRGLFLGMGSALPLDSSLGFDPAEVELVLESGGPPFTVLRARFDADLVARAADRFGYELDEASGAYVRAEAVPAGAPALVLSVPAFALRGRLLAMGSAAEVTAELAQPEWVRRAARALGPDATEAVLAPSVDVAEQARRLGAEPAALLQRHGARAPLSEYDGFAIVHGPDGAGAVVLAYPAGRGGPAQAAALAQRIATTSMLGEPARRLADDFEAGAPRWHEAPGVVRLPVTWRTFDSRRLRADVETGRLLALAPGGH